MSLNNILSKASAARIAKLEAGDVVAIIKAASLGLKANAIFEGAKLISTGGECELPGGLGTPKPITINAWSFVNDRGQYHDTYDLSDARAGELKGLLRTDTDSAVEQIAATVTAALRKKGSAKAVAVLRDGMPGSGKAQDPSTQRLQGGVDLKAEITMIPALYGMYSFVPTDTGRLGPSNFKIPLGGDLFATFQNKKGCIDVARICRVKGRNYPLISGFICLWKNGEAPLFGSDIPPEFTFDGKLLPGEKYEPAVSSPAVPTRPSS